MTPWPLHLLCVCSCTGSQTVVCWHHYCTSCCSNWRDVWRTHQCLWSSPLCVQSIQPHHVPLSVSKNIFQLPVKRCWCFYNLCLGLLMKNKEDGISAALPATYVCPPPQKTESIQQLFFLPYSLYNYCLLTCFLYFYHQFYSSIVVLAVKWLKNIFNLLTVFIQGKISGASNQLPSALLMALILPLELITSS